MRQPIVKESQSMPDTLTIVSAGSTVTGSYSGFMLPSAGSYVITEMIVDGVDIVNDIDIFPQDMIFPCHVQKVTLSIGKIILFS